MQLTIPKVEEGIGWGVPFYKYHGELAGFAAYRKYVSFHLADFLVLLVIVENVLSGKIKKGW